MKRALLILPPEGYEEMEAITPVDFLRRAGVEVTIAADSHDKKTMGAHGIVIEAERTTEEIHDVFDAVILPGGLIGTRHLINSRQVRAILRVHHDAHQIIAAICAAPMALDSFGILERKKFTCYPGCEKNLKGQYVGGRIVQDDNIITGEGPSRAIDFALLLVDNLCSAKNAQKLRCELLLSSDV